MFVFLIFTYVMSLIEQDEACINSSPWSTLMGLEPGYICLRVACSTTVLWMLFLCIQSQNACIYLIYKFISKANVQTSNSRITASHCTNCCHLQYHVLLGWCTTLYNSKFCDIPGSNYYSAALLQNPVIQIPTIN